jgi:DNA polymerase-4
MDARDIRRAAGACLKRVDLTRRLRLLGVRAGSLATLAELVAPLPASPDMVQHERLEQPRADARSGMPLFDTALDAG